MSVNRPATSGGKDRASMILRLQAMTDPAVSGYLSRLNADFGKYILPPEEARKAIDEAMGKTALTELLHKMRRDSL